MFQGAGSCCGCRGFPGISTASKVVGFSAQSPEELQNQNKPQTQPRTHSTSQSLLQRNKSRKRTAKIPTKSPSSRSLSTRLHPHVEISPAARPTTAQAQPGGSRSWVATAGSSLRANGGLWNKKGLFGCSGALLQCHKLQHLSGPTVLGLPLTTKLNQTDKVACS